MDIPDFEIMNEMIDRINTLLKKKLYLDISLKYAESQIVKRVTTESAFFQNGKPPSMNFIETVYLFTGIENELIDTRKEYATTIADLEQAKLEYDLMKTRIDVYRTESANKRLATL